jgi:hypothetical protein
MREKKGKTKQIAEARSLIPFSTPQRSEAFLPLQSDSIAAESNTILGGFMVQQSMQSHTK